MTESTELFETTPPCDIAAEQAVLGAMILGGEEAVAEITQLLGEANFYRPAHQLVFAALLALADRGRPRDPIALGAELTRRGEIARVGGAPYLHTLAEAIPSVANGGHYAAIVSEKARLRVRLDAALHLATLARSDGEAGELVEQMDAVWEQTRGGDDGGEDDQFEAEVWDIYASVIDPDEADLARVVPTGYRDLTEALGGGIRPGELAILGGRPAHGKTTVALDTARAAARAGHRVLFCSLEMGRQEIGQRIMSAEARVRLDRVRRPSLLTEDDDQRLRAHILGERLPISVDYRANSTVTRIRGRVRAMRRRGIAPNLVVVDYLQLLTMSGRAQDNRATIVDEATRQLKMLAKDEGVAVLALSQVNRASTQREDRMPQVSELRESGGIEANADMVLLIHNPTAEGSVEDMGADDPRRARVGEVDIKVGKNRHGAAATVSVAAQLQYSRCVDLARATPPQH